MTSNVLHAAANDRPAPAPGPRRESPFLDAANLDLLPGLLQAALAAGCLVLLAPPATQAPAEPGILTVLARAGFMLALCVGVLASVYDSYRAAREGRGPRSNPLWWGHLAALAAVCTIAWQVTHTTSAAETQARLTRERQAESAEKTQRAREAMSLGDLANLQTALADLPEAVRGHDAEMSELARMAGPERPELLKAVVLATPAAARTQAFFEPLMHSAGATGNTQLLAWLLEQGRRSKTFAEPDALGEALHGATRAHRSEAVSWLLAQGASARGRGLASLCIQSEAPASDKQPETQALILDLLLRAGADPNEQVDRHGLPTPLVAAARRRDHPAMRQLLRAGADPNPRPVRWPTTALQESVDQGDLKGVSILLQAKADPTAAVEPDTTRPRIDVATVQDLARERARQAGDGERRERTRIATLLERPATKDRR